MRSGRPCCAPNRAPRACRSTARARVETDPAVLGVLARTLGRLPYQQESEVRDAERVLIEIATKASTAEVSSTSPPKPGVATAGNAATAANAANTAKAANAAAAGVALISTGVAHGFDALARRAVKLGSLSADARARLRGLARYGLNDGGSPSAADDAASVRRLAVSALVSSRESNLPLLRDVMRDPDEQVRRLGVVWMGAADDMPLRDEAFRQAFGDTSPMVRYEALRVHARARTGASGDCALELTGASGRESACRAARDRSARTMP